ncbi:uncharacterized protein LACBIDRAFT_321145 [Laccaria bicolor S238N-H82]|uniref:Predicted protein n=1 Tax=Laccaria bicolor (strain S238N-H82 / ATCC MYA-4686) TaxID=486041 RepID=B0CNX0_LACBS|nr:uncharacterized protein LACBIDRAFT_321145 [Laccaria bicolor S238N-H82]EDR15364.1 predicted protein [Laccaria bicolor S238N-H82]|eukprot:XP_001873572.1 predicted protein [Laccaria bicolor S238N-H82]
MIEAKKLFCKRNRGGVEGSDGHKIRRVRMERPGASLPNERAPHDSVKCGGKRIKLRINISWLDRNKAVHKLHDSGFWGESVILGTSEVRRLGTCKGEIVIAVSPIQVIDSPPNFRSVVARDDDDRMNGVLGYSPAADCRPSRNVSGSQQDQIRRLSSGIFRRVQKRTRVAAAFGPDAQVERGTDRLRDKFGAISYSCRACPFKLKLLNINKQCLLTVTKSAQSNSSCFLYLNTSRIDIYSAAFSTDKKNHVSGILTCQGQPLVSSVHYHTHAVHVP